MPGRLDAIGIVAADIARSAAFYRAVGLDVPEPSGNDHFEITLPNGLRLLWDTEELIKQIDPDWHAPDRHRVALAFACDSPADVDATYERALAAGGTSKLPPWDAFWGHRYAQVYDPDGQAVDFFAAL
ncbi:MAG TPA: VOC family protein [Gaiellaceae bacterium]|nr:VOC family protein [Gaiellaceae bacterium]